MIKTDQKDVRKSLLAKMASVLSEEEVATVSGAGCSLPSVSFREDVDSCANDA